ncbi:hypothetical protein DF141_05040 [Burkholderia cenocepacia]|nr:hypothetical protein DF141_05040 [Burkholderia cenocepacia]RQZ99907.1 hypothetical protein DF058_03840 [Burkholderia cenocepacia]RRA19013.1 hypothetical protein DF059_01520 [Burkholderia cenocepacia]
MTKRSRTEELTLVFTLQDPTETSGAILGADKVEFQLRSGSVAPLDAFNMVVNRMQALGLEMTFTEGRNAISAIALRKRIETKGTWGHLETATLSFQYGVAGAYDHCFVSIREKMANAAGDWKAWAIPFVILEGFVQGWVTDVEYNRWQNAKDPLEYEAAGRDFAHLPMKSNGLPPPLEQMEIDISRNPGRWVLRSGYVEAVGSTMWLSELFWDRVGRDHKSRINLTKWPHTSEPVSGITEIVISDHCFVSEETAVIQERLRMDLYN